MSTTIRLKNSSALVGGKAKEPTPSDLAQGELAVNTNKDDPSLFVKDSEGVVRKIAGSDATGVEGEYLSLANDAGDQTIASLGTTKFEGLIDANGGVRVGTRATSTVVTGLGIISDVLRINKDSRVRIGISDDRTTVSDPLRVETELDTETSTTTFNCTSRCVLTAGEHEIVHFSSTNTGFDTYATDVKTFVASFNGVKPSGDESNPNYGYGFYSQINDNSANDGQGEQLFSFFADGNSPNFLKGSTYIGGTHTRNTRKLWESTLTEEQKEQLAAGTLTIPANVSNPGDGSFVRQWWYDQQSAEDQALIDSGELEYPERYKAENFVDTFALGDNTTINLLSNGRGEFGGGIKISGSSSNTAIENGFVYDSTNNKLVTIESGSKVAAISEGKFVFGGQTPYDGTLIALRGNLPVNQGAAGSRTSTFIRCEASFPVANDTVTGILVRTGPEADGYTGTFTGFKSFADNANSPNTRWATCTEFKAFESAEAFGYAQNNYAFYSNLGTNGANVNYNFYANGSAQNYFRGVSIFGSNLARDAKYLLTSDYGIRLRAQGTKANSCPFEITNTFRGDAAFNAAIIFSGPTSAEDDTPILRGQIAIDNSTIAITGGDGGPLILDEGADARRVSSTSAITNASAVVQQLNPLRINNQRFGFTAADLQPVVSEAVVGTADATEAIGTFTDAEGVVTTNVTEPEAMPLGATWVETGARPVYQGVDQTKLIPLLTKALQEALERIEELESGSGGGGSELETRLSTLEADMARIKAI